MAANYVQEGRVIDWTNAGAAVVSGDVVIIGGNGDALVGVALSDIGAGQIGAVAIEGVFDLPKADAAVIGAGEYVTWDSSAGAFDANGVLPAAGDVTDGAFAVEAKGATVGQTIKIRLAGKPGVLV